MMMKWLKYLVIIFAIFSIIDLINLIFNGLKYNKRKLMHYVNIEMELLSWLRNNEVYKLGIIFSSI